MCIRQRTSYLNLCQNVEFIFVLWTVFSVKTVINQQIDTLCSSVCSVVCVVFERDELPQYWLFSTLYRAQWMKESIYVASLADKRSVTESLNEYL